MAASQILTSPYLSEVGAIWLQGNLHAHTLRSDGNASPQETVDLYARLGYDFLALSDHDILSDYAGLDPKGLLLLDGSEVTAGGPHVLAIGCANPLGAATDRQQVIDSIRAARGVAVMGHPNWERKFDHCAFAELKRLKGYAGIEIFNADVLRGPGSALATDKWDRLLSSGRKVLGFAHDDSHLQDMATRGWNMVLARDRTARSVLEALAAGSFYASSGVTITRISVEGSRLKMTAPDADAMAVVGEHGRRIIFSLGPELMFDSANCSDPYFRVECFGRAGQMAWTQPFYPAGEQVERRQSLLAEHPVAHIEKDVVPFPGREGSFDGLITRFMDARTGTPASPATGFRVTWEEGGLRLHLRCEEPSPENMKLTVMRHNDSKLWTNDGFEIFLAPGGPGDERYWQLLANAAGFCCVMGHGLPKEGKEPLSAVCKAGCYPGGWTLEVGVALGTFAPTPRPGARWGFNIVRNRYAGGGHQRFVWSFTGSSNHNPEAFGILEVPEA